jgi:hypothetical protein
VRVLPVQLTEVAMSVEEQVTVLKSRHAELEEILESEISRPHPDQGLIVGLKKQKLRIKDELVELGVH